jgi:TPR repeat protein
VKWYKLAAEQDYVGGTTALPRMYKNGWGTPQDYIRAHMWWNILASQFSYDKWAEKRENIAKKMTPVQIAEAQKLARECIKKKYKGC